MSFLTHVREIFRDHTRDELCYRLNSFITAHMAERGHAAEKITSSLSGESLGVIEISGSPVQWANLRDEPGEEGAGRWIEYGVPDSKVDRKYPEVHLRTVRLRDIPFFGNAVGVRWEGDDFGLGIRDRLTDDLELTKLIISSDPKKIPPLESHDLTIRAFPNFGWVLIISGRPYPSELQWRCYESVARHLTA